MGDANIGTRLKKAREKKGLTQGEACEKAGIPKTQTLSAYERGVNSLTAETLKTLSTLYGVSSDWLLFGNEIPNAETKEKNRSFYVRSLIEAVNALDIKISENTISVPCIDGDEIYISTLALDISTDEHGDFYQTLDEIRQLQNVKSILGPDDFNTLIEKRIKLFEEDQDDDLPF